MESLRSTWQIAEVAPWLGSPKKSKSKASKWTRRVFFALPLVVIVLENVMLTSWSETPPPAFTMVWHHQAQEAFVSSTDLAHLSLLHKTCTSRKDVIIPWRYGVYGEANEEELIYRRDPRAIEELRRCPDIDIYLPTSIRGSGYCEDGGAYTKYLRSRLLPRWALDDRFFDAKLNKTVSYHDLCPHTPMLFMNHYWDGHTKAANWPSSKPIYVMPNIEMGELKANDYWQMDAVLCKTQGCYDRVTKWFVQEGNPRGAKVFYTRHTTTDVANLALELVGRGSIRAKDFENVRFTHTAGSSVHKGTAKIIKTWLSRPDLPPLDVYMGQGLFNSIIRDRWNAEVDTARNLQVHVASIGALDFGKILAESAFFLCPSSIEGYGHYINQARAAGGVIISTDAHPMNELIADPTTGVLVNTTRKQHPDMLLGGGFKGEHGLQGVDGLVAEYSESDLVDAVNRVLQMTPSEREAVAKRAQAAYHADTKVFAAQMKRLRAFARRMRLRN